MMGNKVADLQLQSPEAITKVNSLEITDELREFTNSLSQEIIEAESDRNEWEARQDDLQRKRYGIRLKKVFPWVGAANFVLPQIDSDINRTKPAYINLLNASPIVLFEPFGPEDVDPARKREYVFDWRVRTQIPSFFKEYCLGVDYAISRGFTVFKVTWKFTTRKYTKYLDLADIDAEIVSAMYMPEVTDDILFQIISEEMKPDLSFDENVEQINSTIADFRSGSIKFELEFVEKEENQPEVKACDPRFDIVFPPGTRDIQEAQFIDYRYWTTKNRIKEDMISKKFNKFTDDEIDRWCQSTMGMSQGDQIKAQRDGITMNKRQLDLILMHEVCSWYDIDGDGIDERIITTYPDADPNTILRFIECPYDHGMFPYVVVRREFNDAEIFSSRGIPQLGDDFQTGISTLFNQDIDIGTIMTTPTVVYKKNSVKNLRNMRYVPGQQIETENGVNDYSIVQNANIGQTSKFNSMQFLKAWANDRIGTVQSALSQANNMPGQGQQGQKTAKEVQTIELASAQMQSMDMLVWQNQMADVYYQMDTLYDQFGDEDEEMLMTGEAKTKVSRQEIQGKFNRVPNGRLENTSPVLRSQKTLALLQMFGQDPDFKSYELKKLYVDDIDIRLAKRIMLSPEERAMRDQQQVQANANDKLATLQEQMGVRRISDSLELDKEAKLAVIQGRQFSNDDPEFDPKGNFNGKMSSGSSKTTSNKGTPVASK